MFNNYANCHTILIKGFRCKFTSIIKTYYLNYNQEIVFKVKLFGQAISQIIGCRWVDNKHTCDYLVKASIKVKISKWST